MTIRVISLDFDGCLYNAHYYHTRQSPDKSVIVSNICFLNSLRDQNSAYDKVISFVGSNRQSLPDDHRLLTGGREPCFPAIIRISEYINAQLDRFLLTDIYENAAPGTTFNDAIAWYNTNSLVNKPTGYPHWIFDESKVTILYAQMHKTALENPDQPITFDFYDDRLEILEEWLGGFFRAYPELIPSNVTLNLHRYGVITNVYDNYTNPPESVGLPIQGKGQANPSYNEWVIKRGDYALEKAFQRDLAQSKPPEYTKLENPKLVMKQESYAVNIAKDFDLEQIRLELDASVATVKKAKKDLPLEDDEALAGCTSSLSL